MPFNDALKKVWAAKPKPNAAPSKSAKKHA